MKIELKCFYSSQWKINDIMFIVLDKTKPNEETQFWIHEIKESSIVVCDSPKIKGIKQLFSLSVPFSKN